MQLVVGENGAKCFQTKKVPWIKEGFLRYYIRPYLQRHFHAIWLYGEPPTIGRLSTMPLVVCLNHSSWWDLFVPAYVEHLLLHHDVYTVMDAEQLRRYAIFSKMGVLGVDRSSLAGIKAFLNSTETLLKGRPRSLWLTPQGEMVSNYRRPLRFQPGLAHLARRLERFHLLFCAVHYEFWTERLSEAFIAFSELKTVDTSCQNWRGREFLQAQERRLEELLDTLLEAVAQRDVSVFHPLLKGASGNAAVYDLPRAVWARLCGRRYVGEHGAVPTPKWRERTHTHR